MARQAKKSGTATGAQGGRTHPEGAASAPPRGDPPATPRVSSAEPLFLGSREASYAAVRCPVCQSSEATLRTVGLDIPYFGEVFETVFLCPQCGFRHADTLMARQQAACEYAVLIEGDDDLSLRAVKSSSATVEVAELGLLWEPGPASLAEVTNVEGLLRHFEDAVHRAITLFASPQTTAKGEEILDALGQVIAGRRSVRLVLKDPYGNSALIDPRGKAVRRDLAPEEARELLTGEYIFEMDGTTPSALRREPRSDDA